MYARSFKRIAAVDWETFYDDDYSLRKMSTSEYIRDPRFAITALGIQFGGEPHARVYHPRDARRVLEDIDWSETAFAAHHAHFDALILTEHFGIKPAFYIDTLSMGRGLHGTNHRLDLEGLCLRYGRQAKTHKQGLVNMKGVHDMESLPPDQLDTFVNYTADDVEDLMWLVTEMLRTFPEEELQIIDLTIRMFAEPCIDLDETVAERIYQAELLRKIELVRKITAHEGMQLEEMKQVLRSNDKFAELLRSAGVEVQTKQGKKGPIPAISMQDVFFKSLREHPDPVVNDIVEARIAVKSAQLETRSRALSERARVNKAFPVYLRPYGAHTLRWSGGDKVNPQNLDKKSGIRAALVAPDGYLLNIADSSQIEARMNAWFNGQADVLAIFARGGDVYKYTAARAIYQKAVEEITKDERFVGKTCVLGLGYGMGALKFKHTLKIGQFGPPVDMDLDECHAIVDSWRATNAFIVNGWATVNKLALAAFLGNNTFEHGCIVFEGYKGTGYIHVPNGMYLKYEKPHYSEEGDFVHVTRLGARKLYGGILMENIIQCLARNVIAEQMLRIQAELPTRIGTCTHDEVVGVTRADLAAHVQEQFIKIMSWAPPWAAGLPLGAEGKVSKEYSK